MLKERWQSDASIHPVTVSVFEQLNFHAKFIHNIPFMISTAQTDKNDNFDITGSTGCAEYARVEYARAEYARVTELQ